MTGVVTILSDYIYSVDIQGLSISPLGGNTLVQYSGSLTGRDFRAIIQVAPFVLYDLLPPNAFQAWLALCDLVPMVWQPEIYDHERYLVCTHFLSQNIASNMFLAE